MGEGSFAIFPYLPSRKVRKIDPHFPLSSPKLIYISVKYIHTYMSTSIIARFDCTCEEGRDIVTFVITQQMFIPVHWSIVLSHIGQRIDVSDTRSKTNELLAGLYIICQGSRCAQKSDAEPDLTIVIDSRKPCVYQGFRECLTRVHRAVGTDVLVF